VSPFSIMEFMRSAPIFLNDINGLAQNTVCNAVLSVFFGFEG